MVKIFIDPGHGGSDPGAVANGLLEKNINLQIAKRIDAILKNEYLDVQTRLSRTGDQTVSLSQRTNAANSWGADYYLSIHINAGGGTGFESYIYNGKVSSNTISWQKQMHDAIIKQVDLKNRGLKKANFHVLRETKMSAILTENGFIDSRSDANKLSNKEFIEKLARGHVNGLVSIFKLKKRSNQNESTQKKLYKVQAGAFESRENAEKLVEELKKHGFSAFIIET